MESTVSKLARRPGVSFPEAMGSDAELQGGYRLVNNPNVTLEALMEAHAASTAERARSAGSVLAIHDTTSCGFAHADPAEIGYLNTGKAGFRFHYTLIADADGEKRPLGIAQGEALFQPRPPRKRRKKGRRAVRSGSETARDPNRQFLRWMRGIQKTEKVLAGCEVIHIADRECDSYEVFAGCLATSHRFVFRTRVTARQARTQRGEVGSVRELAEGVHGVLTRDVPLARRKGRPGLRTAHAPRKARMATLQFSAMNLEINRPRYADAALPATLRLNLVRVVEPNPPSGEEPVEWLLYTTEPIETPEQIAAIVDMYRARWLIEECNKALKTGCLYEEREFESRSALLALLGMSLPIACEILWLRSRARAAPTRPATDVMTPLHLRVLRAMGSQKLPAKPTVQDALLAVAAMGGHHPSNGDPGWLILQRGMSKLLAYGEAWAAAMAVRGNL